MLVQDMYGTWYDVDHTTLTGKEVTAARANEVIAAERALKREKLRKVLASMDGLELSVLRSMLRNTPKGEQPPREGDCPPCREGDCPPCREGDCDPGGENA